MTGRPPWVVLAPQVEEALRVGRPVVALESAVFSHGLPAREAARLAARLEEAVGQAGAVAALVAVRGGRVEVGVDPADLAFLLEPGVWKAAERDLGLAIALRRSGGTTVSGTLAAADAAGVRVMTTGGIGGVHIGAETTGDVSADLAALSRYPLAVVCAGAKAFCDHGRTAEALDTLGVPVIGYRTDVLPAFLARSSGVPVPHRVDEPETIAAVMRARAGMGARPALLVVQPPPAEVALAEDELETAVADALGQARAHGVAGAALTPFLLASLAEATSGRSLEVNVALLEANARLAGAIAAALAAGERREGR